MQCFTVAAYFHRMHVQACLSFYKIHGLWCTACSVRVESLSMKFLFYFLVECVRFLMAKTFSPFISAFQTEKQMEEGCPSGLAFPVAVKVSRAGFRSEPVSVRSIAFHHFQEWVHEIFRFFRIPPFWRIVIHGISRYMVHNLQVFRSLFQNVQHPCDGFLPLSDGEQFRSGIRVKPVLCLLVCNHDFWYLLLYIVCL